LTFNIKYKKSVERDLKRLNREEAGRILDKIVDELSERANVHPVLKGEFAGLRKLRISDYRVIYAIIENDCLILRIGHRREIYR
jgi:addiction module RelE/StbE family toxin